MVPGEFSVLWFDPDEYSHVERQFVDAQAAVDCAQALMLRPAVRLGVIRRIIITDGGDHTVFKWKHGEGITFPNREAAQ